MLERSIPVPMTADLFLARAEKHARRTGTSLETAIQSLVGSVKDDDLIVSPRSLSGSHSAMIPRRVMRPNVKSSPQQVIQTGQNTPRAR